MVTGQAEGPPKVAHLEIEAGANGFGRVLLDGEDISDAITELIAIVRPGAPTQAVTTDRANAVDVRVGTRVGIQAEERGMLTVRLKPADERALLALGWSPPGGVVITREQIEALAPGDRIVVRRRQTADGGANVETVRAGGFSG